MAMIWLGTTDGFADEDVYVSEDVDVDVAAGVGAVVEAAVAAGFGVVAVGIDVAQATVMLASPWRRQDYTKHQQMTMQDIGPDDVPVDGDAVAAIDCDEAIEELAHCCGPDVLDFPAVVMAVVVYLNLPPFLRQSLQTTNLAKSDVAMLGFFADTTPVSVAFD